MNNDHFSCSGDNSTETKGTAQGARSWNPSHTLSPHRPLFLTLWQLCKTPQCDTKTLPIEKLQLGLKTDWCQLFLIQNKFVKKSFNGLFQFNIQ